MDFFTSLKELFYSGLINVFYEAPKNETRYYILAKITNDDLFNEFFPEMETKYRTQPHWDYYPNKNVIKIELNETNLDLNVSYNDFLEYSTLDIPFFKSFSELVIFIEHNGYINVYNQGDVIKDSDFKKKETELSKKYKYILSALLFENKNTLYITKYFKRFLNNESLKVENVVLYYDKINTLNTTLQIIDNNKLKICFLNETI
jgi:hypothetical protein